ncbi:hypothetical protein Pedsa_1102 [Pseudopedobacter saltans DSM 12145]|uniref:Lipoprotein n=1 Tax=Pseudopedobacter saltans (strain ATCC 51119 / DSM 12145 / JCM 21818 / CCUG 39354 / LMG 10337 / NBRC 100064 / NCIMB 13643) TaxID=762903 RepID=F0SC75_PSESL|nr:hypothetical protein [Pseudopedobacter saltans]ADY51672.1 hypothetical protein Pedsa_1102 [Pseudopedobacter saltans DSM 12145]
MKASILLLFSASIFSLVALTSCDLFKKSGIQKPAEILEIWADEPSASTNKIKVITNLSNDALKRAYISRLLKANFRIDTNRSLNPLTTVMRRHENYYIQLFIDFKDSVATVYGRQGNIGLNRPDGEPSEYHINWHDITHNGKGWEIMNAISNYPDRLNKSYNTKLKE